MYLKVCAPLLFISAIVSDFLFSESPSQAAAVKRNLFQGESQKGKLSRHNSVAVMEGSKLRKASRTPRKSGGFKTPRKLGDKASDEVKKTPRGEDLTGPGNVPMTHMSKHITVTLKPEGRRF